MSKRTILVWFRNDLRTHDNEVLVRALENDNRIVPVYCFDPLHFSTHTDGSKKTGVLRAEFIRRNVIALRDTFLHAGGDLYTTIGDPAEVLPLLSKKFNVDEVYHHREVAHEETKMSAKVESALWEQQINLRHFIGHTLYHKEDLPFPIKDIPDSYIQFRKKAERESEVRRGFLKPNSYSFAKIPKSEVPELGDLGYSKNEIEYARHLELAGGEDYALQLLDQLLSEPDRMVDGTEISPYLSLGVLSPNTYYYRLKSAPWLVSHKKQWDNHYNILMWRDYYRFMFKKHGNLFFQHGGINGQIPPLSTDSDHQFERWKTGKTGDPEVDNSLRQLNKLGNLSEYQRLQAASYLVHNLQGDWLKGAAWFEEKLLDYHPCNNYGNWAHVAGVGSSERNNKPLDFSKILK